MSTNNNDIDIGNIGLLNSILKNHSESAPIILIDFNNMMIIYHNAFRHLSVTINNSIVPTSAFYGLSNLIERILKAYPLAIIIFCMDSGDGGRKSIYSEYKSNRVVSEEKKTLFSYKDKIMSMLSIVPSVYFCSSEGMEADDVLSVLAFTLKEMGRDVNIHSKDYDFAQLHYYGIKISQRLDYGQFEYLTDDGLLERYGVTSKYILHYRVLEGDGSDNIPIPVKFIKKPFKIKFVNFWRDSSYNEALQALHPQHKKEVEKFNTKEARDQVRINMQLMDLSKYRLPQYRCKLDIFKGNLVTSSDFIKEYNLRQFQNFLNTHYPQYL